MIAYKKYNLNDIANYAAAGALSFWLIKNRDLVASVLSNTYYTLEKVTVQSLYIANDIMLETTRNHNMIKEYINKELYIMGDKQPTYCIDHTTNLSEIQFLNCGYIYLSCFMGGDFKIGMSSLSKKAYENGKISTCIVGRLKKYSTHNARFIIYLWPINYHGDINCLDDIIYFNNKIREIETSINTEIHNNSIKIEYDNVGYNLDNAFHNEIGNDDKRKETFILPLKHISTLLLLYAKYYVPFITIDDKNNSVIFDGKVKNPETNRNINVNGEVFKKLINKGYKYDNIAHKLYLIN